ncbi:MAG: hypothetical protein M1832_001886 [Thelocarpon impressellum]|nr:MAG: hypothetical protein M1832_001886 [Thelocarpon impressellum]
MRLSSLLGPTAAELAVLIPLWPVFTALLPAARALDFDPVPVPSLDLSQLGRVGLAGDFDSISLYSYKQQNENGFSTNGSQSVITRLPNGAFASLATADAYIETMCSFVMKGGTLAGVVVGGNFTSLGGIEAQGVALLDPKTGKVTPLPGLSGKVSALYCDEPTNTVYVGGSFKGGNSTNAIVWVGMTGWANLPFAGFNGPVSTIAKQAGGNIVFGGAFDGLGNATTPRKKDQQVVNIASSNIEAGGSVASPGFGNPKNIACKTDGEGGEGKTWLLEDNRAGFWKASFQFGFRPTKLRIWNTKQDGRGTKTFRYTALPLNGIMNLTYIDPATGQNASCDARCPLTDNSTVEFQDFTFVNVVGMSGFQIDISEWYGRGGGLNGIQLLQDDIYAYAINDFNEPTCSNLTTASSATSSGPWQTKQSGQSSSQYLSATFDTPPNSDSASVVFTPDLKQSGNYSVTIYTPGCTQDNSCANRGSVNITGTLASETRELPPLQTEVTQTNDFDKYDEIYNGFVSASGGSFRPTVTLTPSSGQKNGLVVVASRVRFELISSTGGLSGLYEFNPNEAVADTDFTSSIDEAGMSLGSGAEISNVVVHDKIAYVAGNFSTSDFNNIFAVNDKSSSALTGGGLNAEVTTMYLNETSLFVGGNFTNTSKDDTKGLNNVALYEIPDKKWLPLGAGVNGPVNEIVPIVINVTANQPEDVIALTGDFDELLAFDGNPAAAVEGLAIWVPSKKNWLQTVGSQAPSIRGKLTATADVPGSGALYAGTLAAQGQGASGAVTLATSGPLGIRQLPIKIKAEGPEQGGKRKRAEGDVKGQNVTGVVAGYFYANGGRNVTILGGHFTAEATNGSTVENLMFINGSNSDRVTGISSGLKDDAVVLALGVQQDTLYAGGSLTGEVKGSDVNGLVLYDLILGDFVETQPPAFSGEGAVAVNAISTQPNTGNVYVGGSFESAGSLECPSVCYFTTATSQWNRPGTGLSGIVGAMAWSDSAKLVVGGNLTINSTATSLATYDSKTHVWSLVDGAQGANGVPGPVTALAAADDAMSEFWIAGASTNGSAFLMKYDGNSWSSVGHLLGKETEVRGIQVLSLSKDHGKTGLLRQDQTLLLTGRLDLPGFGNASSALFDGTTFTPFILSNSGSSPGSLSRIFSQNPVNFRSGRGRLAVGFVVLIALAISLALIFILVVVGIVAERIRRKREGYMPAPTAMFDKNNNMERIPPSHLFGRIGQPASGGPGGAPMI